jgi:hypothetical protein
MDIIINIYIKYNIISYNLIKLNELNDWGWIYEYNKLIFKRSFNKIRSKYN